MLNNNALSAGFNMTKTILLISNELKLYTPELPKQRLFISSLKTKYHNKINEYNKILQSIIKEETQIEIINSNISKQKQKMQICLYQLSSRHYFLHFKDQLHNRECSHQMSLCFRFCCLYLDYAQDFDSSSYLTYITKESDFKDLLEYAEKYQRNLSCESPQLFNLIKEMIINEKINQYPYDIIYEYFKHIYNIIKYEDDIKVLLQHEEQVIGKKNCIFTEIKALEREIVGNNNLLKKKEKYVNEITSLLQTYKDYNTNNKESKSSSNNGHIYPKEFIQELKDFHPLLERRNNISSSNVKNYYCSLSINSDISTKQKESIGDSQLMIMKSSSKKKILQPSQILSNSNSFCTTNKKFFSSFTEILPDQPDQNPSFKENNNPQPKRLFTTMETDAKDDNNNEINMEEVTVHLSKYEHIDSKESICDELPTSPAQIFSVRTTVIASNNPKRTLMESQEALRTKSIIVKETIESNCFCGGCLIF